MQYPEQGGYRLPISQFPQRGGACRNNSRLFAGRIVYKHRLDHYRHGGPITRLTELNDGAESICNIAIRLQHLDSPLHSRLFIPGLCRQWGGKQDNPA